MEIPEIASVEASFEVLEAAAPLRVDEPEGEAVGVSNVVEVMTTPPLPVETTTEAEAEAALEGVGRAA